MKTLIAILLLLVPTLILAQDIGGVFSIDAKMNTDYDESSINPEIRELSFWYRSNNATMYTSLERRPWPSMEGVRPEGENYSINFSELSYDLELFDLEMKLGKVIIPFGFDYLERTLNSVYMTTPKGSFYDYGLHMSTGRGIIKFDSSINAHNYYTLRGEISVLNEGIIFSTSYTEEEKIRENYGRWSLTNKFLYSSLLLNFSLVTEYLPDVGDIWTRSVLSPGVFDFIGVMGGYYNVSEVFYGLDSYTYNHAWVYGFYLDVSNRTTFSSEWKAGEKFISPLHFRITTTLKF